MKQCEGGHRAWIELDRTNLAKNVAFFRGMLGEGCALMPAVKANAYGHGAALIAGELQRFGVTDFCVASVGEGIELREEGIKGQILVLGFTPQTDFALLAQYDLTQTIVDADYGRKLCEYPGRLKVHAAIDTGMHRLGIPWDRPEKIVRLAAVENLNLTGVFSHLCVADSREDWDVAYTREQIARFDAAVKELRLAGVRGFKTHLQSSYGVLNYPECHYDYARIGIALYGILSRKEDAGKECGKLFPVLSLKSRIACIRTVEAGEGVGYGLAYVAEERSRIAVLPIGYADGIPRSLAGKGYVLIDGKRAPIVGRICMDQMFVDVTGLPGVETADEAVLIGTSGQEQITAEQYAAWEGTISNEIVSRLGGRLERIVKVG